MNKSVMSIIFVIVVTILAACGPSPEEIATQTASAWTLTPSPTNTPTLTPSLTPTDTPIPTNTPTPIPYGLTVSVIDADNNPILWANVIFPESGDDQPVVVNGAGQVSWENLPGENVSLTVSGQGYFVTEKSTTIQRGSNEITVVLERDLNQILPSEACQPGQELLYLEDFEDGKAQGWGDLVRPQWSFGQAEGHGTVISVYTPTGGANTQNWQEFGNAVWLFDISASGPINDLGFDWHISETDEGLSRYFVNFRSNEYFHLHFGAPGRGSQLAGLGVRPPTIDDGEWHRIAFSYFDGAVDVWVDGQLILGADHNDEPLESGGFGLSAADTDAVISFDNFVVCGLNEPYQPVVEGE